MCHTNCTFISRLKKIVTQLDEDEVKVNIAISKWFQGSLLPYKYLLLIKSVTISLQLLLNSPNVIVTILSF